MANEIIAAMKEARRKAHETWWDAAMRDRMDIPEPDYEALTLRAALETAGIVSTAPQGMYQPSVARLIRAAYEGEGRG